MFVLRLKKKTIQSLLKTQAESINAEAFQDLVFGESPRITQTYMLHKSIDQLHMPFLEG